MNKKYLMGVDIGTTGSKAGIFNLEGKLFASGYYEYPCSYPKPLWVEQDLTLVIDSAMAAIKDAVVKSGIDSSEIYSVAFSAQRSCTIFLDASGNLIRPMISWMDNRPVKEVGEINRALGEKEFVQKTGFKNSTTSRLYPAQNGRR